MPSFHVSLANRKMVLSFLREDYSQNCGRLSKNDEMRPILSGKIRCHITHMGEKLRKQAPYIIKKDLNI